MLKARKARKVEWGKGKKGLTRERREKFEVKGCLLQAGFDVQG